LDELDLAVSFQFLRQPGTNVAATGDHDMPYRRVLAPQFVHHALDVTAAGNKEYFVIGFDDGRTFRHHGFAATVYGHHPGIDAGQVLAHGAQLASYQGAAVKCLDPDHTDAFI